PVHFYAEEVAARHPAAADVPDQVREFFAGRLPVERAADGYQAVHRLAQAAGVSREQFVAAYLASRERLEAGEGDTRAPHGLATLLEELRAVRAGSVRAATARGTGAGRGPPRPRPGRARRAGGRGGGRAASCWSPTRRGPGSRGGSPAGISTTASTR